ncbi:hypothetical protein L3067_02785 [Xanthomonas sp. PPL568]|uniref:hypothetical protein n=1 Tax=Xanthomonas indica TaxID=2912242 RepID=UPI001F573AC1|nr:hypothetical protein [Xanthomonas indica]MCI2243537.1 hypothetical protein [Xanthomonas indica]
MPTDLAALAVVFSRCVTSPTAFGGAQVPALVECARPTHAFGAWRLTWSESRPIRFAIFAGGCCSAAKLAAACLALCTKITLNPKACAIRCARDQHGVCNACKTVVIAIR